MKKGLILVVGIIVMNINIVSAEDIIVNSISELNTAIDNANPGDTIILADGIYGGFDFAASGTEDNPITVKAQTPGGVEITGGVTMSGDYLVLRDFYVTSGSGVALNFLNLKNSRVTNVKFYNNDLAITIRGTDNSHNFHGWSQNNRIDHCTFKDGTGVTIENYVIERISTDPNYGYDWIDNQNTYNTVDHCFFDGHRQATQEEAIQIGRGDYFMAGYREAITDNYMVVEYNYFKNYYGDNELISVKSSSNTIRYNKVYNDIIKTSTTGHITIRAGENNLVEGNWIEYVPGTGGYEAGNNGVRVYAGGLTGRGNIIINNHMQGVFTGIRCASGNEPPMEGDTSPFPCANALIAHNTIIYGYRCGIGFGYNKGSYNTAPYDNTIENNLVVTPGEVYGYNYRVETDNPTNLVSNSNIAHIEGSGGAQSGFNPELSLITADPVLVYDGNGWIPSAGGSADNAGSNSIVEKDIYGNMRSIPPDIGAFEIGGIKPAPEPVGVDWDGLNETVPGTIRSSDPVSIYYPGETNSEDDAVSRPLLMNYSRDWQAGTVIRFSLPNQEMITLEVYNILGERVAALIQNEFYSKGLHEVLFYDNNLSTGIYISRLLISGRVYSDKILLVK